MAFSVHPEPTPLATATLLVLMEFGFVSSQVVKELEEIGNWKVRTCITAKSALLIPLFCWNLCAHCLTRNHMAMGTSGMHAGCAESAFYLFVCRPGQRLLTSCTVRCKEFRTRMCCYPRCQSCSVSCPFWVKMPISRFHYPLCKSWQT